MVPSLSSWNLSAVDKDNGRSKEELSTAWIKDKETTDFSFFRSRRHPEHTNIIKFLDGQKWCREGVGAPIMGVVQPPHRPLH